MLKCTFVSCVNRDGIQEANLTPVRLCQSLSAQVGYLLVGPVVNEVVSARTQWEVLEYKTFICERV